MQTAGASGAGDESLVGRILAGKYRLNARLRAGAMGAIYRAYHLSLEKTVCIKIMHAELAKDEHFAQRFHREARAASRFDHPNSILILDYGTDADGTLYIAMELVDGRDLYDLIEAAGDEVSESFSPRRIVDLLSQTLAALAAAHDVGILHRDLKPENILVSSSRDDGERVKVCDFGIAHMDEAPATSSAPESGRRLTRKGFILGTPEYMAPEQARADAVDARSDVYSAGVILYHLLTGRVPFEDDSAIAVALMQINAEPKRPSELVPNVHRELEAVCLKAMKKDPAERYASAREMRTALREAIHAPHSTPIPLMLAAETLSMPSVTATEIEIDIDVDIPSKRPRRKLYAGLGAVALLALAALGVSKLRHEPVIANAAAAGPMNAEITAASLPIAPIATVASPTEPAEARPAEKPPTVLLAMPSPIARRKAVTAAAKAPEPAAPEPMAEPVAAAPPSPEPAREPVTAAAPASPPVVGDPAPAASAPAPAAPAPASAPAAYSLDSAHVDVGPAATVGATASSIDRTIAPIKARIDACYRAALPRLSTVDGTATLHLETDDVGNVTRATVSGGGELSACITRTVIGRRIANVDTGTASADIPLTYRPR